jgi:hypothetical protein
VYQQPHREDVNVADRNKQSSGAAGSVVAFFIVVCLALAAKDGAFSGLGKGVKDKHSYHYLYHCDFVDFYGGVEMQTWEGSGKKRPAASPDPFGAVQDKPSHTPPPGIQLNLIARALTPSIPLPRGSRPSLKCKIVRIDETGGERTIAGPVTLKSRAAGQFIQLHARAS